jgi:hypothetical protein
MTMYFFSWKIINAYIDDVTYLFIDYFISSVHNTYVMTCCIKYEFLKIFDYPCFSIRGPTVVNFREKLEHRVIRKITK